MILRPTRSPLTDTLVPYPTLFRSRLGLAQRGEGLVALAQRHRSFADQIVDAPHVGLRAGELRFGARDRGLLQLHLRLRSEEHTSELQSLMRISYAVFCLKKKNNYIQTHTPGATKDTLMKDEH